MVVRGVGVPGEDVLVVVQVHPGPELLPDVAPLLVAELVAGRGREGDVQHGFSDAGPQIPDRLELGREFSGRFSGHIGVKKRAFLGIEVVGHRALETSCL